VRCRHTTLWAGDRLVPLEGQGDTANPIQRSQSNRAVKGSKQRCCRRHHPIWRLDEDLIVHHSSRQIRCHHWAFYSHGCGGSIGPPEQHSSLARVRRAPARKPVVKELKPSRGRSTWSLSPLQGNGSLPSQLSKVVAISTTACVQRHLSFSSGNGANCLPSSSATVNKVRQGHPILPRCGVGETEAGSPFMFCRQKKDCESDWRSPRFESFFSFPRA
jgi:hypothetical protein